MNVLATRQNDMVSGLLAEYALGGLTLPVSVLVESHLELSPHGQAWMRDLDLMHKVVSKPDASAEPHVFDQIDPVAFADHSSALNAVFSAIEAEEKAKQARSTAAMPKALEDFLGLAVADVPWKKVLPGLAEHKMPDVGGCEVSLLRIDGGKAMPVHTHHGSEITLVLQGAFSDQNGTYRVGDIAYADDEINHKPVAESGEPCICFAVVDAPLELTGPIGRLVNPFIR